jgi:acetolactate synthase-1/2/3 large subunit
MRKITAADYIVEFLIANGVKNVFGYQGGMIAFLFDSFKKYEEKISYHIPYHEQGGVFEASGSALASGKVGFCFVTSGPGFTNALTGIANAYCDSIPLICIAGQVNNKDKKHGLSLRQKGFQEIAMAEVAKPVCKKTYDVDTVDEIVTVMKDAYKEATSGRKGPVVLDVPINVFYEYVEIDDEIDLNQKPVKGNNGFDYKHIEEIINNSKRPIVLAGAGIRQAGAVAKFRSFIDSIDIPVVTTMLAVDVLPTDDLHKLGFIGPDGIRAANYLIDQADCVVSLGARLDPRQTGYQVNMFAPDAVLVRVEIDSNEFERVINERTINVNCDLNDFMDHICVGRNKEHQKWLEKCNEVKALLKTTDITSANIFLEKLSEYFLNNSEVFLDVGKNQLWGAQSVVVKDSTRLFLSGGFGSMGFSLPGAIGACFETKQPVYSINGDGGIQMNIQEFQTIATNKLPVKVIIVNNHALANVVIFQDRWLESRYVGTVESQGDYHSANICAIAEAYGIRNKKINSIDEICECEELLIDDKAVVIEFEIEERTPVLPDIAADKDPLRADGKLSDLVIRQIEKIIM